jgi:hypothetical protein
MPKKDHDFQEKGQFIERKLVNIGGGILIVTLPCTWMQFSVMT